MIDAGLHKSAKALVVKGALAIDEQHAIERVRSVKGRRCPWYHFNTLYVELRWTIKIPDGKIQGGCLRIHSVNQLHKSRVPYRSKAACIDDLEVDAACGYVDAL